MTTWGKTPSRSETLLKALPCISGRLLGSQGIRVAAYHIASFLQFTSNFALILTPGNLPVPCARYCKIRSSLPIPQRSQLPRRPFLRAHHQIVRHLDRQHRNSQVTAQEPSIRSGMTSSHNVSQVSYMPKRCISLCLQSALSSWADKETIILTKAVPGSQASIRRSRGQGVPHRKRC